MTKADVPDGMKRCSKCGEVKALSEFSKKKTSKDGMQSRCRYCCAIGKKAWNLANKDRINAYRRALHAKKPHLKKNANKRHKERYPEYKKYYDKNYAENNREKIRVISNRHVMRSVASLSDGYVKQQLAHGLGITASDCTPELIEAKREQLLIHRTIKAFDNAIKEKMK